MFSITEFHCSFLYYISFFLVFYYRIFVKYFSFEYLFYTVVYWYKFFFAPFHFGVSVFLLAKLHIFKKYFLLMILLNGFLTFIIITLFAEIILNIAFCILLNGKRCTFFFSNIWNSFMSTVSLVGLGCQSVDNCFQETTHQSRIFSIFIGTFSWGSIFLYF